MAQTLRLVRAAVMAVSPQEDNLYAALVETYLKFGLKTRDDHILELYATLIEAYILFENDGHLRIFGALFENAS